ncbi:MAG: PD-(D/E)XK nuclease family protein [Tissierellaceae bacterium]|nr:PD-(D/E)XK nuclease family protein [Tissierellaceae bacterium]
MAKRIVYLGSFNNKKKQELINFAIDTLKDHKGNDFYYILPNGELLRQYRKHFIDSVEQAFEINLFTFDDIVNKVLEDDLTNIIDNPTKNLILREVLKNLSEEGVLKYYKDFVDMPGFIHSINDIIGDIKRSLIYPDEYLERCPKKPFYQEMGLIYTKYEEMLSELIISDREGSYFKSVDLLKTKNFLQDVKTIIIDEFYDFRPIEMAILEQLIKSDIDIVINMPFQSKSKSAILENTIDLLKDLGFTIKNIEDSSANTFENLATNLFTNEEELFESSSDINIISAATPYLELRKIFEEIKRFHKDGTDLNDIGIIITNPSYQVPLHRISTMEGIPLSTSKAVPLKTMPITRELLNILENRMVNFSKLTLINRIKSSYFTICPENLKDIYEILLRKLNFQNIDDLKDIFNSNHKLNISVEEMEHLKDIVQSIEVEFNEIPLEDTIINFNKIVKSIFKFYKIQDNILTRYRETNDEQLFLRDLRTVNKIEEAINKMELLNIFKSEILLEDYYYLLIDYLEEETVIEVQGNIKGVHILNPINSRGSVKDITFITGLAQGSYPSIDNSNYFINDYNLKDLKAIGLDVKNYTERLNNESLKFASMVSSCKNKLYLSYSTGYDDSTIKSMFLDELLSLFKKDDDNRPNINEIKVNLDYLVKKSIDNVTNYDDLAKYLLDSYAKDKISDPNIFRQFNKLFPGKLNSINNKIISEVNRYQDIYDEYSGILSNEAIISDIKSNRQNKFSVSYLESYSKCPYFFMMNNLFKIEEMEREYEEYSPIDVGILYHDVLNKYYKIYLKDIEDKIRGIGEFLFPSTKDTIKDLVYKSAEEMGLKTDSNKDILIIEIFFKKLTNFLEKDTSRIIKDKMIPYGFEIDFGYSEPFIIESNNEEVPMFGRIDRIDKFLDEDKYMAIDYKSSAYGLRDVDHIKLGLSLQLPVYILSQEDKDVIAGAYSTISNGETKISLALDTFIKGRGKAYLSQEEWDELMDTTKENIYKIISAIEQGNFQVNPLECSTYCIYKDICRYEDRVEVE